MQVNLKLIDFLLMAPMLCVFLFSLIPVSIKVFFNKNEEINPVASMAIALIGILISSVVLIMFQGHIFSEVTHLSMAQALVFDKMSFVSNLLVLGLSLLSLPFLLSHPSIRKTQLSEFLFLFLNSLVGMMILVTSNDLIVTFIGLEMMSLCLYMLIIMNQEEKFSKEAAIKYFVLGSMASAIFLYGVSLVYGSAVMVSNGQVITHYNSLATIAGELMNTDRIFLIGYALIVIGFGFKIAMFPFHAWAPDVYQGASTPLTLYMSTAVKAASFFAFARFLMMDAVEQSFALTTIIQWLAILTMLVGNLGALAQTSLKRVLAYSSVAHSGYALTGLLAIALSDAVYGAAAQSLFVYLLGYGLFSIGTFGFLSFLEKKEQEDVQVNALKGLFYKSPWVALGLTISLLGLAGIPPVLGFFAKFYIFSSALNEGLYWLVIWSLVNSVIGVYYYLKPIVFMFFYEQEQELEMRCNNLQKLVFLFVSLVSLIGGIFLPSLLF